MSNTPAEDAASTLALSELPGLDLGTHTATYDDTATILYALAVGSTADELDLVYERDLVALPSRACALGLWAVEAAGRLGAYDPHQSLHAAQRLVMHGELPAAGSVEMTGRISSVLDKGKAAIVQVEVTAAEFSAVYDIYLPGAGGWGGDPGPATVRSELPEPESSTSVTTTPELAALYRLTGDRHPIHIDPVVAARNGFDRPILHGLCTLGIAARVVAEQIGVHPGSLHELRARLAVPVMPGDTIEVVSARTGDAVQFEARVGGSAVLRGGYATFRTSATQS